MKNISFVDQVKCFMRSDCDKSHDHKTEIIKEEVVAENVKKDAVSKMNFQWFDIDQIFAN